MKLFAFFMMALSCLFGEVKQDREFYGEHDFVWLKGFYSQEEVQFLKSWGDELHDAALGGSDLIVVKEANNPEQVCRVEDLITCYPMETMRLLNPVEDYLMRLFDERYVTFKDKLNFKWPGGGAFSAHQDFPAFEWFGPRSFITVMICVDDATEENGCLYVDNAWKGGNQILPFVQGGKDHGSIEPEICTKIDWLPVKAKAGDIVIFSSVLPHYSNTNLSQGPRRALFFTYNRESEGNHRETYYTTKREDPQNPLFHFATPTKARNK